MARDERARYLRINPRVDDRVVEVAKRNGTSINITYERVLEIGLEHLPDRPEGVTPRQLFA